MVFEPNPTPGIGRWSSLIERITSSHNPRVKKAIRLHTSRGRQAQERIIVFGGREVTRAIDAGFDVDELFFCETTPNGTRDSLLERVASHNVKSVELSRELFDKLTYGDRHGEIVAVGRRPSTGLDQLKPDSPMMIVVAQRIEKPGNLGAIFRSADACNVSAVLVADPLTDVFHPNAIRSSTATVFSMPTASGTSDEIQKWLNEHQCNVFTAVLEGAGDYFAANLTGDIAIVVGNEANGLTEEWRDQSFHPVKLPMQGRADSLNVSVTSSVMIYEAFRQRKTI